MPKPPPDGPAHIETRLMVVAEMLDQAVAEVRRAMEEIRAGGPPRDDAEDDDTEVTGEHGS